MDVNKNEIEAMMHEVIDDLGNWINNLQHIIHSVQNEDSIDSYESSYCENCDKPCGRSNAEIFNCMMKKMQHAQKVQSQYDSMHYTKDYLQEDLKDLKKGLEQCNDKINTLMKNIVIKNIK